MNVDLLCYATGRYWESQVHLVESARRIGGFRSIHARGRGSLPASYRRRHREIFRHARGDGYWLWKPYLIQRQLRSMADGDILFYADSGSRFISTPQPLFELAARSPSGLVVFELEHPERNFTKPHVFRSLDMDSERHAGSPQILASYALFRACPEARQFADEWLALCERADLLMDDPAPAAGEAPDFVAHRHDQSLFSLLCKRRGIEPWPDPSQHGNARRDRGAYPQIIDHHRGEGLPRLLTPAALMARLRNRLHGELDRLRRASRGKPVS